MRILVAEDEPMSRLLLQRSVEKLGHECLIARNGEEAWELFEKTPVDVVISDWMMPGIDGVEFCRRVRASTRPNYTYFIFLTALAAQEHIVTGMETGADDYLSKPLNLFDLRMRLMVASRFLALDRRLLDGQKELERLNGQLFEQAHKDPLTLLGNRLKLDEDLQGFCGRLADSANVYSVSLCDIDHFKAYNDVYGHLAGDEVLRRVAATIGKGFRSGDTVYRFGGEEFLVLLPGQSNQSAFLAVDRMRREIERLSIPHQGNPPFDVVTLSAGIAEHSGEREASIDQLLEAADAALYQAKQGGRNRVVISAAAGASAISAAILEPPLDEESIRV